MKFRTVLVLSVVLAATVIPACSRTSETGGQLLMPDYDAVRSERLETIEGRFVTPKNFVVEHVADNELVGSVVNMTFDYKGRPFVAIEQEGLFTLEDTNDDGVYDTKTKFHDEIETAHGLHFIGPGDLLTNAKGPYGTALYRAVDVDLDDKADRLAVVRESRGGIAEHGPHAIRTGPDGYLYVIYGNHAYPDVTPGPLSPSRNLQEDNLLPRYVDPRGHANNIRAPGGTIHRFDLIENRWEQIVGGFRNAFDFDMDITGELFTFDSDMEWDRGLPWFRPVRVIHAIPGGDYGWRTGSSKIPTYAIDTLPGVDDVGRGSPVGVEFYYHDAYPERYHGALFLGDWSRGRMRVIFPEPDGATFAGETMDFVLGEPLNITDHAIGPDGNVYFAMGGRMTHGGLYRVRYTGDIDPIVREGIDAVVRQPMPRSAWGRHALEQMKEAMGDSWATELHAVLAETGRPAEDRLRALEALEVHGPRLEGVTLSNLMRDPDPMVRAQAVYLLGTYPIGDVEQHLHRALRDEHPFVVRRACESLVRAGLSKDANVHNPDLLARELMDVLMESEDKFLRYAARLAVLRVDSDAWRQPVEVRAVPRNPRWVTDLVYCLVFAQETEEDSDIIFAKLEELSRTPMEEDVFLDYLRVVQLAFIRDLGGARENFIETVGPRLLEQFPYRQDWRVNRELQVVLAHMEVPGVVDALLAALTPDKSQEEQIHTAYCLRTIQTGWTHEKRDTFVAWFDNAWEFRGAASMEGFMNNIWQSALELLPEDEREVAEARKQRIFDERAAQALALMEESERRGDGRSDLAQMSFDELAEYLEYDPMAYREPNLGHGERVFVRSKCATCHVFGDIGRGGGPDLSTVVKRFRRRDMLEAIMYPSRVISDQYTGVEVDTTWETITGMVVTESNETLTLITANGERMDIPKDDIRRREASEVSIMPEGLLDTMSLGDLVALIQFLEHGSEV